MFASIVALIICAEFFANGLKVTGLIDALISHAQHLGLGLNGMTIVLTGVVGLVTFLTGSGVGAFSSFAALAPDVAGGLGGTAAAFVTPMRFSFRHASCHVSGCRRDHCRSRCSWCLPNGNRQKNWIPMMAGMISVIICNYIFLG